MANSFTRSGLAIAAIAMIALACISKQIDGQIVALAMVAIAGLGGYELREAARNGPK